MKTTTMRVESTILLMVLYFCCVLGGKLSPLPPMGWMSWERFRCETDCSQSPNACIDENLYRNMTLRLKHDGFVAAGYNIISIDDCWMADERDINGQQVANETRFPSGMKALGDYMHEHDVRFGLYTDEGEKTCGGYPGSKGYEETDAAMYASWGVDYLKVDGCYNDEEGFEVGYPSFGAALQNVGRNITYSCSWPAYLGDDETTKPFSDFAAAGCDLWRNWNDVDNSFASIVTITDHWGDYSEVLQENAGPGFGWNDPDMVLAGDDHYGSAPNNLRLSLDQAKFQLSIWSIVAAPLIMSNDLRTLPDCYRDLLLNPEMIAIDQDTLGSPGGRIGNKATTEVWGRTLFGGAIAVAMINKAGQGELSDECTWNVTAGSYLDAGEAGNIECSSWASLKKLRETCCSDDECKTFSAFNGAFDTSGMYGCTRNKLAVSPSTGSVTVNSQYDGWTKMKRGSKPEQDNDTNDGDDNDHEDNDDNYNSDASVTVVFTDIAQYLGISAFTSATVRDIWARADLGNFSDGTFTADVPSTGAVLLRIVPLDSTY